MTEIKLTPAELELITLKREKEELADKELVLIRQAQLEKDIEAKVADAIFFLIENEIKTNFLTAGFEQLNKIAPGLYKLVEEDKTQTFEVKGYVGGEYKLLWSKETPYIETRIQRIGYNSCITSARKHLSYTRTYTRSAQKNTLHFVIRGVYDYRLENRFYSQIKTPHEKIQAIINIAAAKKKAENLKVDTITEATLILNEKYKGCTVTVKEEYYSNVNYGRRNNGYTKYIQAVVMFENGWGVKMNVTPNNSSGPSFSRPSVIAPNWLPETENFEIADKIRTLLITK